MATQILNLPINIPWKLIAVSPDMMDTNFGNKHLPAVWRSSLAISAYEPKLEELPEELCNERITYLKVTCSITGYQPNEDETRKIYEDFFQEIPKEQLDRIIEEYQACYGVLLNIAVFPIDSMTKSTPDIDLQNYPHIVAFEPKMRDLYQAATETGEILTASNSKLATDKSLIHTETSETGLSLTGGYGGPASTGGYFTGSLSHKWGETDQDSSSVQTEASRERRETQGTVTQLSQMYNLLTGYHQGTNRAAFLMLPRPHVLQSTDRRTFVQGLRQIEGVQEFMLIVSRPKGVAGLCIESFLETGHFPEAAAPKTPETEYSSRHVEFEYSRTVTHQGNLNPRPTLTIDKDFHGFEVDGWEFDPVGGTPGLGGIEEIHKFDDDNADGTTGGGGIVFPHKPAMERYNYYAQSPDLVRIEATLRSYVDSDTIFHRKYRVHLRKPTGASAGPDIPLDKLLITSRGLTVCFRSGEVCPEVVPIAETHNPQVIYKESIVDERPIRLNPALLTRESRLPAMKELLRKVQSAMTTSWRLPSRHPAGEVGFLESDYFKDRIKQALPKNQLDRPLGNIIGLPEKVVKTLSDKMTVAQALEMDLSTFARKTGLGVAEATKFRRMLLGMKSESTPK